MNRNSRWILREQLRRRLQARSQPPPTKEQIEEWLDGRPSPGDRMELSDRTYIVAPDGSWRKA